MSQLTLDEELQGKLALDPVTAYILPLSKSRRFLDKLTWRQTTTTLKQSEVAVQGLVFMYQLYPNHFVKTLWFLHSAYVLNRTAPQIAEEVHRSVDRVQQILAKGRRDATEGVFHAQVVEHIRNEQKTPLEDLHLSSRAYNALRRFGIDCVEDLTEYSQKDILKFRNIGHETLKEIVGKVEECGGIILPN